MTDVCVHRWECGDPTRDGAPGRCRLCGEERVFRDAMFYHDRGHDFAQAAAAGVEASRKARRRPRVQRPRMGVGS